MHAKQIVLFVASLILSQLYGCGGRHAVIVVNGIEIYENYWERAVSDLRPRASSEMQCPGHELTFELLAKYGRQPTEVSVTGCQRRAMYTRQVIRMGWGGSGIGSWMLSSASWAMPATQPYAPAVPPPDASTPPPPAATTPPPAAVPETAPVTPPPS